MTDRTIWHIEQHTLAKHELLRNYLRAWFPILTIGGFNRRVIFLDGFAGPGIYAGGEQGSPLIALDVLVNHASFYKLKDTEFVFIFVEADEDRFRSLESELTRFWNQHIDGRPENIIVYTFNDEFADVATHITTAIGDSQQLAPTFAFIDPFGWSGVPLSLICDLLSSNKCEVLFNFPYPSINRFVNDSRQKLARHFVELFGTSAGEHRLASDLEGEERKVFLCDLYVSQLKHIGNFDFVRPFEILDVDRGRTAYFLVFGTRSIKGLEVMKNAMWNIDPVAGVRFSGFAGDQMMLFDPKADLNPLRRALLSNFSKSSAYVEDIRSYVLEQTDYKRSHCTAVLRELEDEELIKCTQRQKRRTYPDGTLITFLPENKGRLFPLD